MASPTDPTQPNGNYRFSLASRHTGVLNVAMGDGAVRPMRAPNNLPASGAEIVNRTNTAWDALQRLSGASDGDVPTSDNIMP